MQENGLVSNYTVKQYKIHKSTCNNDKVENIVHREFDREKTLDVYPYFMKKQIKYNFI